MVKNVPTDHNLLSMRNKYLMSVWTLFVTQFSMSFTIWFIVTEL